MAGAAALALTAALLHVLNHALFKSAPVLSAPARWSRHRLARLDDLGGLIHRMPHDGARRCSSPPRRSRRCRRSTASSRNGSPSRRCCSARAAAMGPEDHRRPAVGACWRCPRRWPPPASCALYGIVLPRPAAHARPPRRRTRSTAWSTGVHARRSPHSASCSASLPGLVIDALAPVTPRWSAGGCRSQAAIPWLSIVPIAESRSSYNGLLVLLFIAASAARGAPRRSTASPRTRCAGRRPGTAASRPEPGHPVHRGSFAQPIRRVFAAALPGPRARRHAGRPARCAPPRFGRDPRPRLGWALPADGGRRAGGRRPAQRSSSSPSGAISSSSSPRSSAPPRPACGLAMIVDLAVQGLADGAGARASRRWSRGLVRKVKARLLRRQGPPLLQPYRDLARLLRKEVVLADNASWLFRATPYLVVFAATWVAAALVPTFASGLVFSGRPTSSRSSPSSARRASSWRSPGWMSAPASAASARAAR
jgi:hypothetical protein